MPTVTETPQKAYAHCRDPRCAGYAQVEVDGLQVEQAFTGRDLGDNSNTPYAQLVERSMVSFRFANDEDAPCQFCSVPREVTGTARPQYPNTSGYDPNYLVHNGGAKYDPNVVNTVSDFQNAESEAKIAALEAKLNTLMDALAEGDK